MARLLDPAVTMLLSAGVGQPENAMIAAEMLTRDTQYFLLLNVGHFLDHYFMLIFATVAALALSAGWGMSYAELLPYGAPGFAAFALCALPMGLLADRWSRDGMMVVFFLGIGAASILTGLAQSPMQLGIGLFLIGVFGAIYHPVGLAIVTARWRKTGMRLAVNGIWGNLGVGSAALVTGVMIDLAGWRAAFIVPGLLSMAVALPYLMVSREIRAETEAPSGGAASVQPADYGPIWRVLLCVYLTATLGSIVFQATTVALPEIFEERLVGLAAAIAAALTFLQLQSASVIGGLAFIVFAAASLAQLVTGFMLDRVGARPTLALVTSVQVVAFLAMPGLTDAAIFAAALGAMLGVFGQVPVNDFLIGTTASQNSRSRAFGARYLVSFLGFSAALPLIALLQANWGFDALFYVLMLCAAFILVGSRVLLVSPGGRGGRAVSAT
ncbi:MAG: MFS transporter [Pseudomonadota bacterium]